MFTAKDVAEYYDTTQIHYEKWWNLKDTLSLHYGIWDADTKTFAESLVNTNKTLLKISGIKKNDSVLDAGCGVGGAAFFIQDAVGAKVTGISLSTKQIDLAQKLAIEKQVSGQVHFQLADFTKTDFPNEYFDVVWACESVCHAVNKADFIKESYRILKKGGRLMVCDFFKSSDKQEDKNNWMDKWKATWGVPDFISSERFITQTKSQGFKSVSEFDYTAKIRPSAKRLYLTSFLGAVPSEIYNLFHPKVTRFSKSHYKCGYFQYKALQNNLWRYKIVLAVK